MSQSAKAMTYSVLATLAIVLGWMALNPQADNEFDPGVDVAVAEEEVAKVAPFVPASLNTSDTWRANYARWDSGAQDDIPSWEVGYLTEDEEFFGIAQTSNATTGWVDDEVNPVGEATETTVANHDVTRWVGEDEHIYFVAELEQQANSNENAQAEHRIEPSDTMTLILSGSMDEESLRQLAAEVLNQYQ
ncbi:DUF4245 family protein [Yaniella halotolerans]|uniref:DUF4245 family protein n=1 Tax=Yaniella halotolerans TaxID=225453 RepID=UPI0009FC1E14|nr:DUF4245 family protein [Yaniella halotolerans]